MQKNYKNKIIKSEGAIHAGALFFSFVSMLILALILYYTKDLRNKSEDHSFVRQEDVFKSGKQYLFASSTFNSLPIEAKSYVIYDPHNRVVLAGRDENSIYALASVTKVMTCLVAKEHIGETEAIIIQPEDLTPEGDSKLAIGDMWTRDDLISYTLTVSSNDGAHALARVAGAAILKKSQNAGDAYQAFVAEMNNTAKYLNLPSLSFYNETGLDVSTSTNGGYGSALDVAKLFFEINRKNPGFFDKTTKTISYISNNNRVYKSENTNKGAGSVPGLIASKTGFTDLSQGNLAVMLDASLGQELVIVVLDSSIEGRFKDIEILRSEIMRLLGQEEF